MKIYFENEELSEYAFNIDLAASVRIIPRIDENLAHWFWQFSICGGVRKTDNTATIERHILRLKELLHNSKVKSINTLAKLFESHDEANKIYESWIQVLEQILTLCKGKETCSWEGVNL
jgi:hypothetical protein